MDPFTEKLLERTRARRENLQKKMADRPNAGNRPMVKRHREPLADSNSVISELATDKAPQPSSKPSPSKRLCSGENVQPAAGEENQEPLMMRPVDQILSDPPTDKKPPVVPGCRQSSSLERTANQPDVQSQLEQLKTVQPMPEKMAVTTAPQNQSCKKTEMVVASPAPQRSKENLVGDSGRCVAGMKSRLQILAEQRKFWDGNSTSDELPDCTPLSLPKRPTENPPAAVPSASTGTPVGRRGRLANLAATIGSWEDDPSHANIPKENTEETPGKAVPKLAVRDATVAASPKPSANQGYSAASSKSTSSYNQQAVYAPVKASRVFPPSPQKADTPAARPELHSVTNPQKSSNQGMTSISSPQNSNNLRTAFPSSPQMAGLSSTASVPPSPLKNQVPSKALNLTASPQKQELRAKPAIVGPSATQEKTTPGCPVVKSFLERFGEKCQQRNNQSSPAGGTIQAKTPTVTPSVTPNTRLVQDRLKASQAANTTTADLTQKQRMERESELAMIRSRFQNGNNMWKNKDEATATKKITDIKEQLITPVEREVAPCEPQDESTPSISTEKPGAPTSRTPAGPLLAVSPPAMTSNPRRIVPTEEKATDETAEKEEVVTEREMNVDQSINSAVINELFDGVLDQSEEEEEEEEEDALNISSMSLLTPLSETVAAVVKSPERKMMTSTPAGSFIVKSPLSDSKPSKFQRTNIIWTGSSDSVEASDEDHKLPYSISAYRSTRVKETGRPHVKQVIVRKEDVSHRAEEPRGSALSSIKQKMKILTNEMNMQQTVIHQASQALNCCTDEEHGKGSQVEAEAERMVLVAMERRGALIAELDRLKGGAAGQKNSPAAPESSSTSASRGSINLQELRLPLKADFVCSIANKPESTKHSFFIMIRAGAENTVATPLASTHHGLSGDTLSFPTKFNISDVSSDFAIDIQVYCLVQKQDVSSDKKKKPSKSKAITPKRLLGITKSVQTPVVASPGGPNAVRTSNFILVGSHKLILSSIGKNKFHLEKVPFLCPLEGHIYLKMQCDVGSKVEERGFLTMFEDVSGFGAWHRRWCVLSGYNISYWTYPDDEKCKNPIGRINLANCTSKRVEPVNREFCARPHTFELITVRPRREDDKETLVSQCKNTMFVTTNWLSADTKDERNLWMKKLNQIVVDLRMWQPEACYRPL
ncbi:anillin isoform X2 [Platichthys flesus]|uniref:anillin isoform X2 n=1 Tax=Platichthys flesus TaxID=8260 RepID=UPI002DBCD08C|nr:anillin isoform X2 [Platichthys flesus]